ncbi:MAG: hypothetical protein RIT27_34 [Pseudomonadota bacterium]|jgi:hypothetical protein
MKKYGFILLFLLVSCSKISVQESAAPSIGNAAITSKTEQRQGLGTAWGETRYSDVTKTPFIRASNSPLTQGMIYYNDRVGIQNMIGHSAITNNSLIKLPTGYLSFGLTDERGNVLPTLISNNQYYVSGEINSRYIISVQNHTAVRLEVVLSVDGLDVLDGKSASLSKRGYLIEPFGHLNVEGFRQSNNTVAAFRFSAVPQSYSAQKYGETTNVGVIGIAAFEEQGTNWQQLNDIQRRKQANPFPNNHYATPP